jgi:cyclomaltodextrinase
MKLKTLAFLTIALIITFVSCDAQVKVENKIDDVKNFSHPEWSYNVGIYEVNVRQFTEKGNFAAFEKHLPRLKDLGVKILWFMPIHPIGEVNRKGTMGSYYSVKDYKGVNPEFGTLEEFKSLVKKIHGMGMYVIIDWVANHSAWDNPWTVSNPEFYAKDSSGNFMPPRGTDWSDVIQLDYDNNEMRAAMLDALKFWIEETDIDGYRCDVAAMVPTDFWINARKELDKIKPVFMLAEAHEPELHKAFDMTYMWQLKDVMNRMAKGDDNVDSLIAHIHDEEEEYPEDAFRMTFTTNHDENSWNGTAYERLGDGVPTFTVLTGTLPGMMLVYNGQEAGLNKPLEFFEKDLIEWKEHEMFDVFRKLLELKKSNKALWNGEKGGKVEILDTEEYEDVISFVREKDGNKIFTIFNFSNEAKEVTIESGKIIDSFTNLYTGDFVKIKADYTEEIPAWGYRVFYK